MTTQPLTNTNNVNDTSIDLQPSELSRATDTAKALIAKYRGPVNANQFVSTLSKFGIDKDNARSAVRVLIADELVQIDGNSLVKVN